MIVLNPQPQLPSDPACACDLCCADTTALIPLPAWPPSLLLYASPHAPNPPMRPHPHLCKTLSARQVTDVAHGIQTEQQSIDRLCQRLWLSLDVAGSIHKHWHKRLRPDQLRRLTVLCLVDRIIITCRVIDVIVD
jgi:hypothetical protein